MEKVYYSNTYLKNLVCKVEKVERTPSSCFVFTDKTIFYPECGGQPGDIGTLGPYPILDTVKEENGDSKLVLEPSSAVSEGDELELVLNWEHRYRYMIMHTCQHMLSGLLFNLFNIGTVSVHLGTEYLTIETNVESIDKSVVDNLVKAANDKIRENHRIIYHEMTLDEAKALGMRRSIKVESDVRIVEIENVDKIACGGVHVATTGEIKLVMFYHQEQIRGHVRLFFKCAQDAVDYALMNDSLLKSIKTELSCSCEDEILPKLEKMASELSDYKARLSGLSADLARTEIKANLENNSAVFSTNLDLQAVLEASNSFDELALCVFNANKWLIVLKGRYAGFDFKTIKEKLLVPANGRGGGKNGVYQGVSDKPFFEEFKLLLS